MDIDSLLMFDSSQAWNSYCQKRIKKTSTGNVGKFNLKDLISQTVCIDEKEDCFDGTCEECLEETIIDILIGDNIIDIDDECSWTMWKKMNNKFDLQYIIGSVDSLLTTIEDNWPTFLLHTYYNRQQRDYIKELRSQSTAKHSSSLISTFR